jgi:three-Cys-motif partner protein
MIMDVNRNALRKRMEKSLESKVSQLTRLVGDESWKDAGYREIDTLFGKDYVKVSNEEFAEWFRQRLILKAGFKYVPKPMPMKTKNNGGIYYLYFASQKPVAQKIVNAIFKKYAQQ